MPRPRPPSIVCPTCRSPLARVHRHAQDKVALRGQRRYRCKAEACGWEGLLPRRVRRTRGRILRRISRRLSQALLPAAALLGFGGTLAAVAWQAGLFGAGATTGYARGEHHEGEPLPVAHGLARHHQRVEDKAALLKAAASAAAASASAAAPAAQAVQAAEGPRLLSLRYGCVWGQPGRNPYRGDVEQALRSAALPEEVVRAVAAQVRAGQPVDRLEIRNDGVRALASGRVFDARNIAMTYGTTLCLGTRVNFVEGHVEKAALYEAAAADGRVLAVMVPEVCGNVSVLGQSDERVKYERLNGLRADAAGEARWMPAVLNGPQADGAAVGSLQNVPEPGTLSCVLAALGALGLVRWACAVRKQR